MKNKGFTLVELLVVVSLIIIVVGVAGDIVVTVVRSYNKTQITNEVEQNANFVINKLEKELRNAAEIVDADAQSVEFVQTLSSGTAQNVTYSIVDASDEFGANEGVFALAREVESDGLVALTNYKAPIGVTVDQASTSFEKISDDPDTVKIVITLRQIGNPAVQFTQSTTIEKTVVVRGSY